MLPETSISEIPPNEKRVRWGSLGREGTDQFCLSDTKFMDRLPLCGRRYGTLRNSIFFQCSREDLPWLTPH
jgi:hypothetical protein